LRKEKKDNYEKNQRRLQKKGENMLLRLLELGGKQERSRGGE